MREPVSADVDRRDDSRRHRLLDVSEDLDRFTTRYVSEQPERKLAAHHGCDRQELETAFAEVRKLLVQGRPNRRGDGEVVVARQPVETPVAAQPSDQLAGEQGI